VADLRLDDIAFDDPDVDATLARWREAIEGAYKWYVSGAATYDGGVTGHVLHIKGYPGPISAVVTTAITAKPDADTLGQGIVTLRVRKAGGPDLADGPSVRVYSNFSVEVPVGTDVEVAPDGADYKLIAVDYCPEP
jgi:hypothetical protein